MTISKEDSSDRGQVAALVDDWLTLLDWGDADHVTQKMVNEAWAPLTDGFTNYHLYGDRHNPIYGVLKAWEALSEAEAHLLIDELLKRFEQEDREKGAREYGNSRAELIAVSYCLGLVRDPLAWTDKANLQPMMLNKAEILLMAIGFSDLETIAQLLGRGVTSDLPNYCANLDMWYVTPIEYALTKCQAAAVNLLMRYGHSLPEHFNTFEDRHGLEQHKAGEVGYDAPGSPQCPLVAPYLFLRGCDECLALYEPFDASDDVGNNLLHYLAIADSEKYRSAEEFPDPANCLGSEAFAARNNDGDSPLALAANLSNWGLLTRYLKQVPELVHVQIDDYEYVEGPCETYEGLVDVIKQHGFAVVSAPPRRSVKAKHQTDNHLCPEWLSFDKGFACTIGLNEEVSGNFLIWGISENDAMQDAILLLVKLVHEEHGRTGPNEIIRMPSGHCFVTQHLSDEILDAIAFCDGRSFVGRQPFNEMGVRYVKNKVNGAPAKSFTRFADAAPKIMEILHYDPVRVDWLKAMPDEFGVRLSMRTAYLFEHRHHQVHPHVQVKLYGSRSRSVTAQARQSLYQEWFGQSAGLGGSAHVRQVLDYGVTDDMEAYGVFPIVDGPSLDSYLYMREPAFDEPDLAEILPAEAFELHEAEAVLRQLLEGVVLPIWADGLRFRDCHGKCFQLTEDGVLVFTKTEQLALPAKERFETPGEWAIRDAEEAIFFSRFPRLIARFLYAMLPPGPGQYRTHRLAEALCWETGLLPALQRLGRDANAPGRAEERADQFIDRVLGEAARWQ